MKRLNKLFHFSREKLCFFRLSSKMSVLIITSVIIPLFVAVGLFNSYAGDALLNQIKENAGNSFSQLYDIFSSRFDLIRQNTLLIQLDSNTRLLLQDGFLETDITSLANNKALMNTTFDYLENKNIWDMSIKVFLPRDKKLLYDNERFFDNDMVDQYTWYQQLVSNPYKNGWYFDPDDQTVGMSVDGLKTAFSYLVRVCKPTDLSVTTAVIRFDFTMEKVMRSLSHALPASDGSTVYLLAENNDVILQYNRTGTAFLPVLPKYIGYGQATITQEKQGALTYYIQQQAFKYNAWRLVMAVPLQSGVLTLQNNEKWMYSLLAALAAGLVILIVALYSSRHTTRRIDKIMAGMSNLQDGILKPLPPPKTHDEIGMLIESYNYLTDELRLANVARDLADANQKHSEMIALQAQINPHFLYNTLEMINYYAMTEDTAMIEKIVTLLARFYKRCLNQGEEYSTLEQELDLIRSYWRIQEIRYHGKITFVENVALEVLHCQVPHMILQPLIENAIYHGIMSSKKQAGNIYIKGEQKNDLLQLQVTDDGAGMHENFLHQLSDDVDIQYSFTEEGSHYGLRNINQRLINLYGEDFGLHFQSTLGLGTTITILIPMQA